MSTHLAKPASVYRIEYPFRIYLFDKLVVNEIGRPMWISHFARAPSRPVAERMAKRNGWKILGEFHGEEDAGPELGDFCDAVVRERDREWLERKGVEQ